MCEDKGRRRRLIARSRVLGVLILLFCVGPPGIAEAATTPPPPTTYCCYTTPPPTSGYTSPHSTVSPSPSPSRGATSAPYTGRHAVLVLDPPSGRVGITLTVTGSGFAVCAPENRVDFSWDSAGIAPFRALVASNGSFKARLTVPERAAKGSHAVRAQCGQKAYAASSFDVTADGEPTSTSTAAAAHTGSGTAPGLMVGGLAAGGLLAAGLVGYLLFFRRQGPRWTRNHVRAVMRPGFASDGVQDVGDPPESSRTVQLEPRWDPGEQSIEETDR
ncbi:hypothetical protein [Yinghuangia seranimata]|uniref:hypothetical protein n=1 Tax=Yinghuangia seranimata TaxID=408067 RepID=UPI00248D1C45|nr:hypothetical protein [Yinghuangia seranimata]MDI2128977.1 hypothetical protein [Yinghuangia seranimata]